MTGRLGILVVIAACSSGAPDAPAPIASASSSTVAWIPARAADRSPLFEASARAVDPPAGRAVVSAPLRARIVASRTELGATVAAGAPLVELALPEAAEAAARYLGAHTELAAHERRATQLGALRAEGFARAGDVVAAEIEVARLESARQLAAATLRAAGLSTAEARGLVTSGGRMTLRAPIDGVITELHAIVGATHDPEAPLVMIAGGDARRVEARLPRPLPAGTTVEFLGIGAAPIAAHLVASAPTREPDGTTRAWFELEHPTPLGTLGRIRGTLVQAQGVTVPAAAIARGPRGAYVWRDDGGTPRQVTVQVLATSGGDAVVEGVAVGDRIAAVATDVTPAEAPR